MITFSLFLSISSLYAKTLVVSDIDDTIKITDVLSKSKLVYNGLVKKKAFSGMSELYQSLNSPDTMIFYISGSPTLIEERVERFLHYNKFPQTDNVILKKGKITTAEYKLREIRKLILEIKPDKILLIGDDTQFDPEIYDIISKENGEKVDAIYIRAIQNRDLPHNDSIKNFFSPVEIAGFELLKGNINREQLQLVSKSFVTQSNASKVVINHRYCPLKGRDQILELEDKIVDQVVINSLELAQKKIIDTCKE